MVKLQQKVNYAGQTIFAGIDVHLKSWNVTLFLNDLFLRSFNQPPQPAVLSALIEKDYPGANLYCAYEAGFCGFWIQREFARKGIKCIIVNAADVPQTDKESKTKTDRIDSKRIAKALRADMLSPVYVPDEEIEADRQLVRINEKLGRDLIRYKNRIKGFLYQMGISIPRQFSGSYWSNKFLIWLDTLPLQQDSLSLTLACQLKMVRFIRQEKLDILRKIRQLLRKPRYVAIAHKLLSVPGIGPITAITLITEIADIKRFKRFEHLNSFVGFCPSEFSSGEKIHKGGIINRHHRRLRVLLIEASWVAIKNDPAMSLAYNNYKFKSGSKRAIIKIARKLLSRIRMVWLTNTFYEYGIVQ